MFSGPFSLESPIKEWAWGEALLLSTVLEVESIVFNGVQLCVFS